MLPQELIRLKRDRKVLDPAAIREFVAGIGEGRVGDEQLGAFAMAVFLNGMRDPETVALTEAMRDSGRVLHWAGLDGPVMDKHSTGGVGDTVSLILGPWVAACGGYVPMVSGRGLGHTGGTLDKLQAIPGYDPFPSMDRLRQIVTEVGCAIIGQTDDLAPADRRLYAVRDVTATVECLPLIVASILSKKLSAGLEVLVMDVKTGSGSVMGSVERAVELARAICRVAAPTGTHTRALITDMNQVLARSAGNALEVAEAVAVLTGEIRNGRLLALTRALAAEMLVAGALAEGRAAAEAILERALESGAAAERFARMIAMLGGPVDFVDQPEHYLPRAKFITDAHPDRPGRVQAMDVREVGLAVIELGGGRSRASDPIDRSVGLTDIASLNEPVDHNRPLARVHARSKSDAERAIRRLRAAFSIDEGEVGPPPLVYRGTG